MARASPGDGGSPARGHRRRTAPARSGQTAIDFVSERMNCSAQETNYLVEALRIAARLYERDGRTAEARTCLQAEHILREGGRIEGCR